MFTPSLLHSVKRFPLLTKFNTLRVIPLLTRRCLHHWNCNLGNNRVNTLSKSVYYVTSSENHPVFHYFRQFHSSTNSSTDTNSSNESHSNNNTNSQSNNSSTHKNNKWFNIDTAALWAELKFNGPILVQFILLAQIMRWWIGDFIGCVGPSMLPTLNLHGDLVIVDYTWKWRQHLHDLFHSKNTRETTVQQALLAHSDIKTDTTNNKNNNKIEPVVLDSFHGLERGDIVVAKNPFNKQERVSKRVIGLPGDIIRVRAHTPDTLTSLSEYGLDIEHHRVRNKVLERFIIIPANHIYILGDNLNNSADSRIYGPIPIHDVIGKVKLRIWPLNQLGTFEKTFQFANQPKEFPYHMNEFLDNYQKTHPYAETFNIKRIDDYDVQTLRKGKIKDNSIDVDLHPKHVHSVPITVTHGEITNNTSTNDSPTSSPR